MYAPRNRINTGVKTHGMRNTPEFRIWYGMLTRCYNPNTKSFPDYGGRGITVCQQWLDSFEQFYADMGRRPSAAHQIDRIENEKGYAPGNCKWSTRKEQSKNRRSNVRVDYQGETLNLTDLAEKVGLKMVTLRARLLRGWSLGDAVKPLPGKGRGIPRPKE